MRPKSNNNKILAYYVVLLHHLSCLQLQVLIDHVNTQLLGSGKYAQYPMPAQFLHDLPFFVGKLVGNGFHINTFNIVGHRLVDLFQQRILKKYHAGQVAAGYLFQEGQLPFQR